MELQAMLLHEAAAAVTEAYCAGELVPLIPRHIYMLWQGLGETVKVLDHDVICTIDLIIAW
jgi:hypothetical protein